MVGAAMAIGLVSLGIGIILMFGFSKWIDAIVEFQEVQIAYNEDFEKRIKKLEKLHNKKMEDDE